MFSVLKDGAYVAFLPGYSLHPYTEDTLIASVFASQYREKQHKHCSSCVHPGPQDYMQVM